MSVIISLEGTWVNPEFFILPLDNTVWVYYIISVL